MSQEEITPEQLASMAIPVQSADANQRFYNTPRPLATQELGDALAANSRSVKPVKQSRDRAQYVRQQKGHSFLLHWFVLGILTCFIVPVYYSVSPNHYWHL